jgi:ElaB/YqjD/DUF883 family membrane-anchored ribosome-binding protein
MPELNGADSEAIAANFAALRGDIAKLSDSVTTLARHQADATGAAVGTAIDTAKGKLAQAATSAQGQAMSVSADFERRIAANPLTAVLIAAGVGVTIGLMTKSR